MTNTFASSAGRILRPLVLIPTVAAFLAFTACGGNGNSSNKPKTSKLTNRAFVSNTFSGGLQIVDTQTDVTATTGSTVNSFGQIIPGTPLSIPVANNISFEVESPDHSVTVVYSPSPPALSFVTNVTEKASGNLLLNGTTGMALFSPDSSKLYMPEPNLSVSGATRLGGVQVLNRTTSSITANYAVASARYVAISPSGQYLFVFADNSDSVFLIDLNASTVTPVEVPGFARPINAFFSSDSNTAYVLNCGPECGSSEPASVARFDIPSKMITASVPVGGASVGLMNGNTLYVAGSPVPPGTSSSYDAVDIGNMSRITMNSVAIGDGFHTTMALATNNKLYIGANSCSNTVTGCLSVVDVSSNTAEASLPPRGAVTSLLAVKNRNVMYAVEGGVLNIYDTNTNTLQGTQLTFTGALYSIVQVDP